MAKTTNVNAFRDDDFSVSDPSLQAKGTKIKIPRPGLIKPGSLKGTKKFTNPTTGKTYYADTFDS